MLMTFLLAVLFLISGYFLIAGYESVLCPCMGILMIMNYKNPLKNFPWDRDISVTKIFKYLELGYIVHVCGFVVILSNKNKFQFPSLLYECNFIFLITTVLYGFDYPV